MAGILRLVAGQAVAAGLSALLYMLHPWLGLVFWPSTSFVLAFVLLVGRGRTVEQHERMLETLTAVAKAVDSENAYPPRPATEIVADIRLLVIACVAQLRNGTPTKKDGGA